MMGAEFLHGWDISVTALVLALGMLVTSGLGVINGRRLAKEERDKSSEFTNASMALLGLLLAFSFGMSISKHDQRRLALVADSNAVGDFYTCATLLQEPARTALQAVIKQYLQLRLSLTRGEVSKDKLEASLVEFDKLHARMTNLVGEALNKGTPIAVPLTNTLNAVTSNQAARLAAYRDRLPPSVIGLLFASAILTAFLVGRDQGLSNTWDFAGTLCFIVIVSLAVYVTLDLNLPEGGWIRLSQEPIERLLSTM